MACQTGIRADEQLLNFFQSCKQCKVRMGKIVINNEKMSVNFYAEPTKDWRKDWKGNLPNCLDSYEPCFILFRFDSSHDWILISFADDKASSDFGQSFIRAEYQVANRNDLTLDIFESRYLNANTTSNTTTTTFSFAMQSSQTMRGIQFPIDQDACQLLKSFAKGEIDFVQMSVDTLNEAIKLDSSKTKLSVEGLSAEISKQKPRYSLFRFAEAEDKPVFFIYSVPPSQSCTIKELMLFSSCKAPFLSEIQNECGVKITKKIEVDSRDKLDEETLLNYIRPEALATAQEQFIRPTRPGNGPRRITKVAQ
uniref:ADF-H domain-containing protein n=1 Tax=Ditylenchus dipsaci TaxID=166011 RepID=A0A915EEI3_9BILA